MGPPRGHGRYCTAEAGPEEGRLRQGASASRTAPLEGPRTAKHLARGIAHHALGSREGDRRARAVARAAVARFDAAVADAVAARGAGDRGLRLIGRPGRLARAAAIARTGADAV